MLKHQTLNFANRCRLEKFTYFILHPKNLWKLNLGIILIKSDTNFEFQFFLFLNPWSVPFIMNQPNICFYMFIICIFMRGQFWTLEHSPSHCSRVQFWTRTISPADSPPFQFGNTSHWSLDSYTTPMDPPEPPPPPTTSQGGGSAPSPPKIDKLPKIYVFM